jgi:hypothetical protein
VRILMTCKTPSVRQNVLTRPPSEILTIK